jgi:polysaccharide pyruvyl transferase WcaK-like protein
MVHFYNVVLMGYYGYSNLGDDLLFLTTLHIISKHSHIKNVFVPAPKRLERLEKLFPKKINVKIINRYNPLSVFRTISKSHATIFGGGNLFQDETSYRSFMYYYLTAERTLSLDHPLILLSQGFGPVGNLKNVQRLKKIVNSPLTYGLLRDMNSFHYASKNSDNFTLSVDYGPLFLMKKLDSIKQTRDAKMATIVLKAGIRVNEIIEILKANGIEKIFVIGFQNHREEALIESSALQARNSGLEILRTSDNWKDIITNIANSRIVITERLHGGLLSLYFGVPFIWLKGKKLDEVLSTTINNYELSYSSETGNLTETINKAIRIETLNEASENYRSNLEEAEQKASKLLQDVIYE